MAALPHGRCCPPCTASETSSSPAFSFSTSAKCKTSSGDLARNRLKVAKKYARLACTLLHGRFYPVKIQPTEKEAIAALRSLRPVLTGRAMAPGCSFLERVPPPLRISGKHGVSMGSVSAGSGKGSFPSSSFCQDAETHNDSLEVMALEPSVSSAGVKVGDGEGKRETPIALRGDQISSHLFISSVEEAKAVSLDKGIPPAVNSAAEFGVDAQSAAGDCSDERLELRSNSEASSDGGYEYSSSRRSKLEYVMGSTPWLGETPPLVRELALEAIALEEELGEQHAFSDTEEEDEAEAVSKSGNDRAFQDKRKSVVAEEEERRFRIRYATVTDKEKRLQAFAARQMANRMLGCLGYLCSTCWLPQEDCMCGDVPRVNFNTGVCFWLYMHPKEYLRKNNTGKLLWQVLGEANARISICGVGGHEAAMWQVLRNAGRESVWCVYPARKLNDTCVEKMVIPPEVHSFNQSLVDEGRHSVGDSSRQTGVLHFVLIDGTWSNSRAMLNRLMEHSRKAWDGEEMTCVSLSPSKPSIMHGLRPQPSKERTCTAAAAANLLRELEKRPEVAGRGLQEGAEGVDRAVAALLAALSARRRRSGRSSLRLGAGKSSWE